MKYYDVLELNKDEILKELRLLFKKHKIEEVGFSECIVLKENVEAFIQDLNSLGILIESVYWWCFVNPKEAGRSSCPHGMGGPRSKYYDGWFSELQNEGYIVDEKTINIILREYDLQIIKNTNIETLDGLRSMLSNPFRYTPTDYIEENRCVNPALLLLFPDDWRKLKKIVE